MRQSRRSKLLEELIAQDFDRMLAVKDRGEQHLYFARMRDHVNQRSAQQVQMMERARGIYVPWFWFRKKV